MGFSYEDVLPVLHKQTEQKPKLSTVLIENGG